MIIICHNGFHSFCFSKKSKGWISSIIAAYTINGKRFHIGGLAVDEKRDYLFVSDFISKQVLVIDLNLNLIKKIDTTHDVNFMYPRAICFKNDQQFVCDYSKKLVLLFNNDLECIDFLQLDYYPLRIKASTVMLCVGDNSAIYFYYLNDLCFFKKFDFTFCQINTIDSAFYAIDGSSKIIYCFYENGVLNEKFTLNGAIKDILVDENDGSLIRFKNGLLMLSFKSHKIVKFSN